MKTTKLILGIISIVLFVIILIQSMAAGLVNAFSDSAEDTSGAMGLFFAFIFLIAGILAIVLRKSRGGSITAGVFYLVAALIGLVSRGVFKDLIIWGVIALIFGIIIIIGSIKKQKPID